MNKPLQSALLAILAFSINCGGNNAYAYALTDFIKQAEVIKVNAFQSATSQAIKVTTTIKGFAANDPYMIKTLDVPKATFLSNAKANMGSLVKQNAWYAGWFAAMAAAGWSIDELKNQVVSKDQFWSKGYFYIDYYASYKGSTPEEVLKNMCSLCVLVSVGPLTDGYNIVSYVQLPSSSGTFKVYKRACTTTEKYLNSCAGVSEPAPKPVPDDALYDSFVSEMMKDPQKAANAFMVPDPYPYPYPQIFPSTVPYIPGVAESDQEALDWYYKGLLQSTNPNAPYYVTPERYQQIAAMAQQLQQGQTPQGQVDALNNQLKNPLTQKQLEESLKKEREAQDKATKDALGEKPNLDSLLDPYKAFEQDVKGTPNNQVNQLPSNTFSIGGSGQCYTFDKSYSIMGATWTLSTRQFCDAYYYPYFLPILTWFFYCCTGLYIWFSIRDAFARRV